MLSFCAAMSIGRRLVGGGIRSKLSAKLRLSAPALVGIAFVVLPAQASAHPTFSSVAPIRVEYVLGHFHNHRGQTITIECGLAEGKTVTSSHGDSRSMNLAAGSSCNLPVRQHQAFQILDPATHRVLASSSTYHGITAGAIVRAITPGARSTPVSIAYRSVLLLPRGGVWSPTRVTGCSGSGTRTLACNLNSPRFMATADIVPPPLPLPAVADCNTASPGSLCVDYCLGPTQLTDEPCNVENLPLSGPADTNSWIYYTASYSLSNATVSIVAGTIRADGTCEYSNEVDVPPAPAGGDSSLAIQETGFNPLTCQFQVATGTPPDYIPNESQDSTFAVSTPSNVPSIYDKDTNVNPPPVNVPPCYCNPGTPTTPGPVTLPNVLLNTYMPYGGRTTHQNHGYYTGWYEDPFGIDVAKTRAGTTWDWNSYCVTGAHGDAKWVWYGDSGWALTGHNWINTWYCGHSNSSVYGLFKNKYFCAVTSFGTDYGVTTVEFNRNTVLGRYDGHLITQVRNRAYGCDSDLLSFNHVFRNHNNY